MNEGRVTRRRIVVAFDASPGSRAALEAAAGVAARLDADLEGLFVEDEDLLRLAGLPFARALGAGGHRGLDAASMERALREQGERAEQAMARVGRRLAVPWRFRTTRGRVGAELLAAAAGAEVIALGTVGGVPGPARLGSTTRALLAAGGHSLLLAAPGARAHGTVACLFDASPAARRALARAAALAGAGSRRLVVYLAAVQPEEAEVLQRAAAEELSGWPVDVRYRRAPMKSPESLARAISSDAPATVVAARPAGMSEAGFRAFLARLHGIIWLTGSGA